jgi:hypothetical protein
MSGVAQAQFCIIQKSYAKDMFIWMKIVHFCLAAFNTSGK